jgi:hypothetical protein
LFVCEIDLLTAELMRTSSVVGYYALTVGGHRNFGAACYLSLLRSMEKPNPED